MDLQIQTQDHVMLIAEIKHAVSHTAGIAQCLAAIIRVAQQQGGSARRMLYISRRYNYLPVLSI